MTTGGNYLLVGDGAALPLLRARLRRLPAEAHAIVVVEAEAPLHFEAVARITLHRVSRHAAYGARTLNDLLRGLFLPQDGLRAWVSCHHDEARRICDQQIDDHGVRRERLEASGGFGGGFGGGLGPVLHTLDASA